MQLPIYETKFIGSMLSKDGEEFDIYEGLSKEGAIALKEYSLDESDEAVQKHTSDRKRFGEGSYEDWYAKVRFPFSLIQKSTGKLAALAWLGPEALDGEVENWHTIAHRSYGEFRGKGIMKQFSRTAVAKYMEHFPDAKIWSKIKKANEASQGLASAMGFVKLKEDGDSVIMVKES